MNDVWVCISGKEKIVVRCESVLTAYEVRQFAAKKLGTDPASVALRLSNIEGSAEPTVEVRWTGDDYAHGGTANGRRMQERASDTGQWVDA